jgi:high-affinity nickel permease
MDSSLSAALGLGFLLGLRHATDADHVAAVSTLLSRHRSLAASCLLGTFWGAGHTAALLAAGVASIVFQLTISTELENALEIAVAFVLILLGGNVLFRSLRAISVHRHRHSHEGSSHSHVHLHLGGAEGTSEHFHLFKVGGRPFLVGLLHGLAGSGALMLVVLTTIPSSLGKLLYLLVFGVGSTGGMLLLSGVIGVPFAVTAGRWQTANATIQALAGASSLVLGVALARDLWGA